MPGLANELIMIIEVYENKKKICSEEFETASFFFLPLVELGDKYGITNDLLEYHENTKEALILRKNRRLSKEELNKLNNSSLDEIDQRVLDLLNKEIIELKGKSEVKDFLRLLRSTRYGSFEDVICFFEDNEIESIKDSIVIITR